MVRVPLVAILSAAISSASFAVENPAPGSHSFLVRVEDDGREWQSQVAFPSGEFEASSRTCKHFSIKNAPPECAPFVRRALGDKEKSRQHAEKTKASATPSAASRVPAKKSASRGLSEQERNAQAAKPLFPLLNLAAIPPKTAPAQNQSERLHKIVGQLLLIGFNGKQPGDAGVRASQNALRSGRISGVIVQNSNIANETQLRQLVSSILLSSGDTPPIIAVDQPGGLETALPEDKGFVFYASASAVGSGSSPSEAQLLYREMATGLAALGVNLNIGPSEDACREEGVNLSGTCFGIAPSRIADFARAFNFGHHDAGILAALRHVPFRAGLRTSSINESASAAILHNVVRAETSDALVIHVKAVEPLRLQEAALHGKLQKKERRSFGFDGAMIFDLDMGSGGAPLRFDEAILRSLQSGADMILIRDPSALPPDLPARMFEAVQKGLKSERLTMARIEDAYRHVQRLKERLRVVRPSAKIAGLSR